MTGKIPVNGIYPLFTTESGANSYHDVAVSKQSITLSNSGTNNISMFSLFDNTSTKYIKIKFKQSWSNANRYEHSSVTTTGNDGVYYLPKLVHDTDLAKHVSAADAVTSSYNLNVDSYQYDRYTNVYSSGTLMVRSAIDFYNHDLEDHSTFPNGINYGQRMDACALVLEAHGGDVDLRAYRIVLPDHEVNIGNHEAKVINLLDFFRNKATVATDLGSVHHINNMMGQDGLDTRRNMPYFYNDDPILRKGETLWIVNDIQKMNDIMRKSTDELNDNVLGNVIDMSLLNRLSQSDLMQNHGRLIFHWFSGDGQTSIEIQKNYDLLTQIDTIMNDSTLSLDDKQDQIDLIFEDTLIFAQSTHPLTLPGSASNYGTSIYPSGFTPSGFLSDMSNMNQWIVTDRLTADITNNYNNKFFLKKEMIGPETVYDSNNWIDLTSSGTVNGTYVESANISTTWNTRYHDGRFHDPLVLTLDLTDSYGDGWNGAQITLYQDSEYLGQFTMASGSSMSYDIYLQAFKYEDLYRTTTLTIEVNDGSWPAEVGWILYGPSVDTAGLVSRVANNTLAAHAYTNTHMARTLVIRQEPVAGSWLESGPVSTNVASSGVAKIRKDVSLFKGNAGSNQMTLRIDDFEENYTRDYVYQIYVNNNYPPDYSEIGSFNGVIRINNNNLDVFHINADGTLQTDDQSLPILGVVTKSVQTTFTRYEMFIDFPSPVLGYEYTVRVFRWIDATDADFDGPHIYPFSSLQASTTTAQIASNVTKKRISYYTQFVGGTIQYGAFNNDFENVAVPDNTAWYSDITYPLPNYANNATSNNPVGGWINGTQHSSPQTYQQAGWVIGNNINDHPSHTGPSAPQRGSAYIFHNQGVNQVPNQSVLSCMVDLSILNNISNKLVFKYNAYSNDTAINPNDSIGTLDVVIKKESDGTVLLNKRIVSGPRVPSDWDGDMTQTYPTVSFNQTNGDNTGSSLTSLTRLGVTYDRTVWSSCTIDLVPYANAGQCIISFVAKSRDGYDPAHVPLGGSSQYAMALNDIAIDNIKFINYDTQNTLDFNSAPTGAYAQDTIHNGWTFSTNSTNQYSMNGFKISSGGTSSSNTGPSAPPSGTGNQSPVTTQPKYGHLETSSNYIPNNGYVRFSKTVDLDFMSSPAISFDYHMHGTTTDRLKVEMTFTETTGTTGTIVELFGDQGTAWLNKLALLTIPPDSGLVKIDITLWKSTGFRGDIGISSINIFDTGGTTYLTSTAISTITNITAFTADLNWTGGNDVSTTNIAIRWSTSSDALHSIYDHTNTGNDTSGGFAILGFQDVPSGSLALQLVDGTTYYYQTQVFDTAGIGPWGWESIKSFSTAIDFSYNNVVLPLQEDFVSSISTNSSSYIDASLWLDVGVYRSSLNYTLKNAMLLEPAVWPTNSNNLGWLKPWRFKSGFTHGPSAGTGPRANNWNIDLTVSDPQSPKTPNYLYTEASGNPNRQHFLLLPLFPVQADLSLYLKYHMRIESSATDDSNKAKLTIMIIPHDTNDDIITTNNGNNRGFEAEFTTNTSNQPVSVLIGHQNNYWNSLVVDINHNLSDKLTAYPLLSTCTKVSIVIKAKTALGFASDICIDNITLFNNSTATPQMPPITLSVGSTQVMTGNSLLVDFTPSPTLDYLINVYEIPSTFSPQLTSTEQSTISTTVSSVCHIIVKGSDYTGVANTGVANTVVNNLLPNTRYLVKVSIGNGYGQYITGVYDEITTSNSTPTPTVGYYLSLLARDTYGDDWGLSDVMIKIYNSHNIMYNLQGSATSLPTILPELKAMYGPFSLQESGTNLHSLVSNIPLVHGDLIQVVWNTGSWSSEVRWDLKLTPHSDATPLAVDTSTTALTFSTGSDAQQASASSLLQSWFRSHDTTNSDNISALIELPTATTTAIPVNFKWDKQHSSSLFRELATIPTNNNLLWKYDSNVSLTGTGNHLIDGATPLTVQPTSAYTIVGYPYKLEIKLISGSSSGWEGCELKIEYKSLTAGSSYENIRSSSGTGQIPAPGKNFTSILTGVQEDLQTIYLPDDSGIIKMSWIDSTDPNVSNSDKLYQIGLYDTNGNWMHLLTNNGGHFEKEYNIVDTSNTTSSFSYSLIETSDSIVASPLEITYSPRVGIDLIDTYGDGWNGNSVKILINGQPLNHASNANANARMAVDMDNAFGNGYSVVFSNGTLLSSDSAVSTEIQQLQSNKAIVTVMLDLAVGDILSFENWVTGSFVGEVGIQVVPMDFDGSIGNGTIQHTSALGHNITQSFPGQITSYTGVHSYNGNGNGFIMTATAGLQHYVPPSTQNGPYPCTLYGVATDGHGWPSTSVSITTSDSNGDIESFNLIPFTAADSHPNMKFPLQSFVLDESQFVNVQWSGSSSNQNNISWILEVEIQGVIHSITRSTSDLSTLMGITAGSTNSPPIFIQVIMATGSATGPAVPAVPTSTISVADTNAAISAQSNAQNSANTILTTLGPSVDSSNPNNLSNQILILDNDLQNILTPALATAKGNLITNANIFANTFSPTILSAIGFATISSTTPSPSSDVVGLINALTSYLTTPVHFEDIAHLRDYVYKYNKALKYFNMETSHRDYLIKKLSWTDNSIQLANTMLDAQNGSIYLTYALAMEGSNQLLSSQQNLATALASELNIQNSIDQDLIAMDAAEVVYNTDSTTYTTFENTVVTEYNTVLVNHIALAQGNNDDLVLKNTTIYSFPFNNKKQAIDVSKQTLGNKFSQIDSDYNAIISQTSAGSQYQAGDDAYAANTYRDAALVKKTAGDDIADIPLTDFDTIKNEWSAEYSTFYSTYNEYTNIVNSMSTNTIVTSTTADSFNHNLFLLDNKYTDLLGHFASAENKYDNFDDENPVSPSGLKNTLESNQTDLNTYEAELTTIENNIGSLRTAVFTQQAAYDAASNATQIATNAATAVITNQALIDAASIANTTAIANEAAILQTHNSLLATHETSHNVNISAMQSDLSVMNNDLNYFTGLYNTVTATLINENTLLTGLQDDLTLALDAEAIAISDESAGLLALTNAGGELLSNIPHIQQNGNSTIFNMPLPMELVHAIGGPSATRASLSSTIIENSPDIWEVALINTTNIVGGSYDASEYENKLHKIDKLSNFSVGQVPNHLHAVPIQINNTQSVAVQSTITALGGNWSWYSGGAPSDPNNNLSVFLESLRNSSTHMMRDRQGSSIGVLTQTSGSATYDYNFPGFPGSGNDSSANGIVLQYTAVEARTLLFETLGNYYDSVIVIFTEAHITAHQAMLSGQSAPSVPFKPVVFDSGDHSTFRAKFPYSATNPEANIYYIGITSYNTSYDGSTTVRVTPKDNGTSSATVGFESNFAFETSDRRDFTDPGTGNATSMLYHLPNSTWGNSFFSHNMIPESFTNIYNASIKVYKNGIPVLMTGADPADQALYDALLAALTTATANVANKTLLVNNQQNIVDPLIIEQTQHSNAMTKYSTLKKNLNDNMDAAIAVEQIAYNNTIVPSLSNYNNAVSTAQTALTAYNSAVATAAAQAASFATQLAAAQTSAYDQTAAIAFNNAMLGAQHISDATTASTNVNTDLNLIVTLLTQLDNVKSQILNIKTDIQSVKSDVQTNYDALTVVSNDGVLYSTNLSSIIDTDLNNASIITQSLLAGIPTAEGYKNDIVTKASESSTFYTQLTTLYNDATGFNSQINNLKTNIEANIILARTKAQAALSTADPTTSIGATIQASVNTIETDMNSAESQLNDSTTGSIFMAATKMSIIQSDYNTGHVLHNDTHNMEGIALNLYNALVTNINDGNVLVTAQQALLTSNTASSLGDPHINTITNKTYELARIPKIYRLLQSNKLIVNASTRKINKDEIGEIMLLEKKHNKKLVKNGVYYDEIYIKSDGHTFKFCFDTKQIKCSNHFYFKSDGNKLLFTNSKHGLITLTLKKDANIMLKNSFSMKLETVTSDQSGLLTDEYLLKSMEVNTLKSEKHLIGVKGKNPVLSKLIKIIH